MSTEDPIIVRALARVFLGDRKFWSPTALAKRLRLSRSAIYNWVKAGKLDHIKCDMGAQGRALKSPIILIPRGGFAQFLARQRGFNHASNGEKLCREIMRELPATNLRQLAQDALKLAHEAEQWDQRNPEN